MPDLDSSTWELVDHRVEHLRHKLAEVDRYRQARAYAPMHAALEKLGAWADELAETVVSDLLGQINPRVRAVPPLASGDTTQISLSDAQVGVLTFVCESEAPVSTGPSSNFTAGWVSGSVAAALVNKGLLQYTGTGTVQPTPAGHAVYAAQR
jgi:hypothetical protein